MFMSKGEALSSRLTAIIIELHQSGTVERKLLAEKFHVTERTIYRDLNRLSPIVESAGNGVYRLSISARTELDNAIPRMFENHHNSDGNNL